MKSKITDSAGFQPMLRPALLLATAALVLAGCNKGSEAPTGQVVAKLDGKEITVIEVNSELRGQPIPPNMQRRDAEKLALDNIITRRMLAAAAGERNLDKSPEFSMEAKRAEEQLKVQALARDIAQKVVAPTRDDADRFIAANPSMFSERKIYVVDQIQFLRPENISKMGFEAAQTMQSVEEILNSNGIRFRRQPAALDSAAANPSFVQEVTKVLAKNPQEIFMFASRPPGAPGPVVMVNQVRETRVEPFTGDKAREFAINYLRNERIQNALKAEVEKQQKTLKERVVYQAGWSAPAKKAAPTAESLVKGPATGAEKSIPAAAAAAAPLPAAPATAPAAPAAG